MVPKWGMPGEQLSLHHRPIYDGLNKMQQLFISYSRKDIGFVRRLALDLENAGYEVWWDVSDLRGGDDWVRVIPEAIASSDAFLVVLSPESIASEWVRKEYTQALSLRKRIIPVMLERTAVPFALNTINYLDFTSDDEYAASLNSLLRAIGYSGEPVVPVSTLPMRLRRYAVPIILGILILLALASHFAPNPPAPFGSTPTSTPSVTPVIPTMTLTATVTPEPSPTPSATATETSLPTETFTPRPTLTPSATRPAFEILIYCVNSLYANTINVRSGPGTIYAPIGEPLQVGRCLAFRGRNEEATWLLIAPNQTDTTLQQYEGGWIYRDLLGLGTDGPIDLPAVTLTPTPTPSNTPTITPTSTPSNTPTLTPTFTPTNTPIPTDTETSTS